MGFNATRRKNTLHLHQRTGFVWSLRWNPHTLVSLSLSLSLSLSRTCSPIHCRSRAASGFASERSTSARCVAGSARITVPTPNGPSVVSTARSALPSAAIKLARVRAPVSVPSRATPTPPPSCFQ